ncbi:MAG: hypothetical protein A2248_17220 [Candidatus Raymondbacteria bacterium RIFOXYA2_FULL_49_16]|uniref:Secretion system C-terminal sorting domain-containing protein n=1 Tax=Candidatus Raymondbacteria bacterium RIFOXYD12_FULL_49_13 TaxID=1817890 RepID=A0A1F7F9C5_UNCRA|nr:MAG: hypothetical protein A2248_17220 [Candidatus Raymondbacteria bacterium RIFOXYA2_FULL_49_16]OGK03127.1 MAG: hypothetical protein A2519_06955 [Candidatus Raymondbacteria bacterium RIFOXYD12_FULL_49_13]OGP44128.1 MAG: hypothetical protein A2324_07295 [Candidatus Raymondbacteria bacterium RIFOXYB2_FULL_49_35]
MFKYLLTLSLILVSSLYSQETHVFWYKALQNHYALADSPGPALPVDAIMHEGKIATCNNSVGLGYAESGFSCGSGIYDTYGWCSLFYSTHINDSAMTGRVDSAFIRGEYWYARPSSIPWCHSGPINIRCGVVDVTAGIEMWDGVPGGLSDDAVYQDLLLPASLDYSLDLVEGTADTFAFNVLLENLPTSVDSHFVRVPITKQIDWIVQHHNGKYAVALLSRSGEGSTGEFTTFANEACYLNTTGYYPPIHPWTTDGNTTHLVVYGNLSDSVSTEKVPQSNFDIKVTIVPNPFNPFTKISISQKADVDIYDVRGKLVDRLAAQGSQPLEWNASRLPGGVYYCRVRVGGKTVVGKMVYLP